MNGGPAQADLAVVDARCAGVGRPPTAAEREQQLAGRGELLDGMVEVIRAVDVVFTVDLDAMRSGEVAGPPVREIVTGAIEHEDRMTVGTIEDERAVLRVRGDGGDLAQFAAFGEHVPMRISGERELTLADDGS